MPRVGIGYDVHPFADGRALVLGGEKLPGARGLKGHSDADALCHAIADALLGALALGDLGTHFPDSNPQWKDADSLQLLAHVNQHAVERGFGIVNIDSNVSLERPRLRDHVDAMREKLASTLVVDPSCVSVKAKTGEGLDAVGRGEAVTAQAIVLLAPTSWFPGYDDDEPENQTPV